MQIGIIGINHKLANLLLRDQFAKVCEKKFHHKYFKHSEHSLILLSTCNRTEIYFTSSDLAETHSYLLNVLKQEVSEENFDQKLYSYFGYECFNHLSRVTSGLDSACVAETEIQGQVKNTYESVLSSLNLPYDLHYLFQKALAIGKQIRSTLNLGRGLPDLPDAVLDIATTHFSSLKDKKILFVGGSNINQKIASHRKLPTCYLMTRSEERALELQESVGLVPVKWNLDHCQDYDWIIFGSKASDYLLTATNFNTHASQLIMDLSVPRNVDPALALQTSIKLLNIDEINCHLSNRQNQLKTMLDQADDMVAMLTERHLELWHQKINSKFKILALA